MGGYLGFHAEIYRFNMKFKNGLLFEISINNLVYVNGEIMSRLMNCFLRA